MPGLRSLVARRRSSLTSPPYTAQRNTPSPSHSDTSDHAATPHTSEGGESPMTERGGSVGEGQETQSQDASDAHPSGSSTAQDASLFNGEEAEKRDGGTDINVEDSKQEEGLLETSETIEDSGEESQSSTSARNINEKEKESPPPSEVSGVGASDSLTGVQGEVQHCETIESPADERHSEQVSEQVKDTKGESYMDTDQPTPEVSVNFHTAGPLQSWETSENKEETVVEVEKPIETEGSAGELADTDGERELPVVEETQENIEELCDVDTQKENKTVDCDADVRQETTYEVEPWDTGGGGGGGVGSGSDDGGGGGHGGEESGDVDISMTSVEDEYQATDESQLLNKDYGKDDLNDITEETYFPLVAEEDATKNEEPTNFTEEEDCNVDQTNESEALPSVDDMETSVMDVSDEALESETKKTELQSSPKCTREAEGSPSTSGMGTSCEFTEGDAELVKDIMSCEADDEDSAEEKHVFGEGEGESGNADGDGNVLEAPAISEGDCNDDSEGNSEQKEMGHEDSEETNNAESKDNTQDMTKELSSPDDINNADAQSSENVSYEIKTTETEKSLEEKVEDDNNVEKKDGEDPEVIYKAEPSPSSRKADGADSDAQADASSNKNLMSKINQKNTKGGKKCSDLSAMEIESTLASRGVTIVRRVVDNKEQCSRGSESSSVKQESGTSIKPVNKGVFAKAIQSPFRGTPGSGISVSLQPSSGQANSPTSKDLYKSISARGTHIQASSKINPALLNRRGSFQLTKGVSIHYNPKSGAANTSVRGGTVYSNLRGVSTAGRGPRMMHGSPRGAGAQTLRGYPANVRGRGAGLAQIRRGAPQSNLRGLAAPVNTRGMTRPQRYASQRGAVPRGGVMPQPRGASMPATNLRGAAPQSYRGALNQQHQARLPGLLPQGKPGEVGLVSKPGESLQSRSTTMPPQAKYLKTSPDPRSTDDKGGLPLQGMSSHPRLPDTLQSPQPGSAEVSPQNRASQFSPQTLMSGIQTQSEYGSPAAQSRTNEQSPQSVLSLPSASAVSQAGPSSFTSQPVSASHSTLPSSSHHLSQMSMMDHHPSQSTNTMGLPPHSVAGGGRLPPHSSGGFMPQPTSLSSSSQVMPPPHLATSNRFSLNIGSPGFPSMPSSEYHGRPGTEMFPTYNNPGQYTPHSSTGSFPHMTSGDFGLQSTSGGYHAQTSLVGFPASNDPCAYPQHPSSSEFSHNPTGVGRPPCSDAFGSHPSITSFPVQGTPGAYPPIPCSEPYSTPANPGADIYTYPGQRDFMMHPNSREFSHYSTSTQMGSQLQQPVPPTGGHRDVPMSQSPRELPIQNCSQGLSMPSSGGNSSVSDIIGEQYQGYGDQMSHSSYQDIPVNARTNPTPVPLPPSYRESDSRQNYRDSATPQFNNYRESGTQEGLRTPQMHSGYRGEMTMNPNLDLQSHITPREQQSAHSSFKEQQSARYHQEEGMITRYLEQSVLNYPESGTLNSCREQPVPNYGSPASHASPGEQVLASCRDNMNQMSFPETISDNSSRQQLLPGLGEQMNYSGYRGPLEYNSACDQPNPNLQESVNYASNCQDAQNINQASKSAADNMYKNTNVPVSSYSITSHHLSMEGVQGDLKFKEKSMAYPEGSILPSFTESFDHSTEDMGGKKGHGTNLHHYRGGSSEPAYQRNLPEYTNSPVPFNSQGGDASSSASKDFPYPCPSDSKNVGPRESPGYQNQMGGGYATPSSSSYSPAQSCSPDDVQYVGASGDNLRAKSDFHIPGDSLVPPDKGILEYPISQGSSSTNNTQRNPSGRYVPGSSVTNPETDISSSVNHVGKNDEANFLPVVESHKNGKRSETLNFLGCGKGGETTRSPGGSLPKSPPESRSVDSPEKFPVGMSPSKSDSGSPSTQDRIVIKMKLLHSGSSGEENTHGGQNGNITELRLPNKNSFKYGLAKYTRWTIDSIINGREDVGNEEMTDKDSDYEVQELGLKEGKKGCITDSPKKTRKRRNSEVCEDFKDTNLDTNKNFMKRSLKITITNPLRNKVSPDNSIEDRGAEKLSEDVAMDSEKYNKGDNDKVQSLSSGYGGRSSPGPEPETQFHYSARNIKIGLGKPPSPSPSGESCSSGGEQLDCEGRRCGRGREASPGDGEFCGKVNDHLVASGVKKCSIVIKRIYKNDNYSCYSSSLCDKKTVLSIDSGTQRRSKRRAAVEAIERCHKTLRSLDSCNAKSGKITFSGVLSKSKDILSVNLTTNKAIINQIPECSVILYDVFMNRRINQMVCPGCSRHYDSSDSVQVNMNKATISLLCSSCQWLVVKDVHPHEVDSLVPS